MSTSPKNKILQYLREARAHEVALVRVLQSQIAMTPEGPFRSALEAHLDETRDHARRLSVRIGEVEGGFHPLRLAVGIAEAVTGQALALAKTPLDLVRGNGGEEKVLKNAKDAAATEALEIATYTALERLATRAGDSGTAELAAAIRIDEERMLDRLLAAVPELTDAVYAAEVEGRPSYDPSTTGAAQAAGAAREAVASGARDAGGAGRSGVDAAVAAAEDLAGGARDAVRDATSSDAGDASSSDEDDRGAEQDDDATAERADGPQRQGAEAEENPGGPGQAEAEVEEVADALADAGPVELPWPDYEDSTVEQIRAVLLTADAALAGSVVAFERAHEDRREVIEAAERLAHSS